MKKLIGILILSLSLTACDKDKKDDKGGTGTGSKDVGAEQTSIDGDHLNILNPKIRNLSVLCLNSQYTAQYVCSSFGARPEQAEFSTKEIPTEVEGYFMQVDQMGRPVGLMYATQDCIVSQLSCLR